MLKCIKLHKRIHIIVILHIYRGRVPSVHGRWFQRKSSRARIKKQFSASLKWVSIFGSQILTLSLQTNEGEVWSDCYGNVSPSRSWPVHAGEERCEQGSWSCSWSCSHTSGKQSCGIQRQRYNAINGVHHCTNTGSPLENNVCGFDLCPLKQISIKTNR